jgi:hypothetical protein
MSVEGNGSWFDIPNMKEGLKITQEHEKIVDNMIRARQKDNLVMDHALKSQRKAMNLMTRQFAGGGVLGQAMNMLQQVGGMGLQNMQDKYALRDKVKSGKATDEEKSRFSMLSQSKTTGIFEKLDKVFEKNFGGDSKWNKMFGGRGKMAAGGMALGAAGAGIGIASKIIDSSPLMQQMLKLLNFGIMLVLRPIGDFFGMLMRPILILLLRKFIIPFYQTVYPWFLNAANQLNKSGEIIEEVGDSIVKSVEESGKFITAKLEPIMKPDIKTGVDKVSGFKVQTLDTVLKNISKKILPTAAAVTPKIKPPTMKPPVFKSKLQDLAKIDNPKNLPVPAKKMRTPWLNNQALAKIPDVAPVVKSSTKAVNIALKSIKAIDAVASLPAKAAIKFGQLAIKGIDKSIQIADSIALNTGSKVVNKATTPLKTPAANAAKAVVQKVAVSTAGKIASKAIPVVGQVLLAVDALGSTIQAISPETYTGINTGIRAGGASLGIPDWLTEGALDFVGFGEQSTAQQLYGLGQTLTGTTPQKNNNSGRRHAFGGMISEEVRGFGKSGRRYVFGEGGSEMVTPMSKMGRRSGGGDSGVTVNVTVNGSIYSDKDMLNFQRTIMRAIETSNTRKAKL